MSTARTFPPSSGQLELNETFAQRLPQPLPQPLVSPSFQATTESQPGSGPSGWLGLRDAGCFQAGGCLGSPPGRPRPTPKLRSQGTVAGRPYRAGISHSAVQASPKKGIRDTQRAHATKPCSAGHAETDPHNVHDNRAGQPPSRQQTAAPFSACPRYSAFPRPNHKQTYQALGVQLVRIPEELDKWHEIAAAGLNPPLSTPTAGQAGLGVASVDQKDAGKRNNSPQSHSREPPEGRPRCPGASPLTQGATPMESSIDAADFPTRDTLLPATANGVPQGHQKQNTEDQRGERALSSLSGNTFHTSTAPAEPLQTPSVKPRAMKSRQSAVFRTAKRLPAPPKSPKPSVSDDAEANSLCSGSGFENGHLNDGAEHRRSSNRLDALLPATTMGKREKTLAALPVPLMPPRTLRAVATPARKARAAPRPRPAAIAEDDETPPEKPGKENRKPNVHQCSDTPARAIAQGRGGHGKGVGVVKAELAKTSNQITSTPSSSETALNDVLSVLGSLESEQHRAEPPRLYPSGRRRDALQILSPPRRLQRAVMMRRQRIAETARQGLDVAGQPGVSDTMPTPEAASKPGASAATSLGASKPPVDDQGESSAEEDKHISDRDVLNGLKIICAASADVEFDALVRNKTGLRLRRFLADLQSFEQLGELGLGVRW